MVNLEEERSRSKIDSDISEEWAGHRLSERYKELAQEYWAHPDTIKERRAELLSGGGAPGKLDEEIEGLIWELNKEGYITFGSCAGHNGGKGYVAFLDINEGKWGREDKERIREIFSNNGIRNIRFMDGYGKGLWTGVGEASVHFRGIG